MNIKKAFDYMISHSTKEDRPAYEQICSELSDHLELWVEDKERIAELETELEAENKRLNDLCADRQKWRSRMGLKTTDDVVKENKRLRKALQDILEIDWTWPGQGGVVTEIAQEALEETP